jgi:hypothetical protein
VRRLPRPYLPDAIEIERRHVSKSTAQSKKSELGQFLTPAPIARFMAKMLVDRDQEGVRLLDPGAGIGTLSAAVLERAPSSSVTAYEVDLALLGALQKNLGHAGIIFPLDFLHDAVFGLTTGRAGRFTHAIINPPYKKIGSDSPARHLLRKVGLETVNLYAGFVGVAMHLLETGGLLCAIVPRSFCNGPYYKLFREFLLNRGAILKMHIFDSRSKPFGDEDVLQENIIILVQKGAPQGDVQLSRSHDGSFSDLKTRSESFVHIVHPSDPERTIRFPTGGPVPTAFQSTLADLRLQVSTGPVVDFRVKQHLLMQPESGSVPLIYPGHFRGSDFVWPQPNSKKPNAIRVNADTQKWLFPKGDYVLVRRFSAKEERRRIVAHVLSAQSLQDEFVGIENHLNIIHFERGGIDGEFASGLAAYLNSSQVDENFRTFSGHTQVNATDLRMMTFPDREQLLQLGRWSAANPAAGQQAIDSAVGMLAS